MTVIKKNFKIEESNFEKILANVKRELEKSGTQFGDSIKLLKDTWAKQTKEINSFISALKEQNGKVDFKNLLSGNLNNTKKQISFCFAGHY
mgnify:CR=1 FL=1